MSSVLDRVAVAADRTVSYDVTPDQVYDVRLPRGSARGVTLVLVHGGFWRPATDRTHAGSQAAALADAGFHVVVPEYRRAENNGWPEMKDDLLAALEAIGADPDLPESMILMGHSAGGQLVAWAAAQSGPAVLPSLRGVVALAGCLDLHLTYSLDLGKGAARALMGGSPDDDPGAWTSADPALLGTPSIPIIAVHGSRDQHVPLSVSQSYATKVPGVALHVIDGADHLALIDPQSSAFEAVTEIVTSLGEAPGL